MFDFLRDRFAVCSLLLLASVLGVFHPEVAVLAVYEWIKEIVEGEICS